MGEKTHVSFPFSVLSFLLCADREIYTAQFIYFYFKLKLESAKHQTSDIPSV